MKDGRRRPLLADTNSLSAAEAVIRARTWATTASSALGGKSCPANASQGKTGKRLRIAVVGELKAVVDRIAGRKTTFPVHSLALVVNEHGQPLTICRLAQAI